MRSAAGAAESEGTPGAPGGRTATFCVGVDKPRVVSARCAEAFEVPLKNPRFIGASRIRAKPGGFMDAESIARALNHAASASLCMLSRYSVTRSHDNRMHIVSEGVIVSTRHEGYSRDPVSNRMILGFGSVPAGAVVVDHDAVGGSFMTRVVVPEDHSAGRDSVHGDATGGAARTGVTCGMVTEPPLPDSVKYVRVFTPGAVRISLPQGSISAHVLGLDTESPEITVDGTGECTTPYPMNPLYPSCLPFEVRLGSQRQTLMTRPSYHSGCMVGKRVEHNFSTDIRVAEGQTVALITPAGVPTGCLFGETCDITLIGTDI